MIFSCFFNQPQFFKFACTIEKVSAGKAVFLDRSNRKTAVEAARKAAIDIQSNKVSMLELEQERQGSNCLRFTFIVIV